MMIRQVRSFVSRNRKLTLNQKTFLKENLLKYCINFNFSKINLNFCFGNSYPVILEIGFGTGQSLVNMAIQSSRNNFLGIEVYTPSILSCLRYIQNYNLKNIKIIFHDAVEVMSCMIPDSSLFGVHIFFPDPWFKKRHHKRRMIKKEFLDIILSKLMCGGYLHIATDCEMYADDILNTIKNIEGYINLSDTGDYIVKPSYRFLTKFEQRGRDLGNKIFDLKFKSIF